MNLPVTTSQLALDRLLLARLVPMLYFLMPVREMSTTQYFIAKNAFIDFLFHLGAVKEIKQQLVNTAYKV